MAYYLVTYLSSIKFGISKYKLVNKLTMLCITSLLEVFPNGGIELHKMRIPTKFGFK